MDPDGADMLPDALAVVLAAVALSVLDAVLALDAPLVPEQAAHNTIASTAAAAMHAILPVFFIDESPLRVRCGIHRFLTGTMLSGNS